MICFRFKDIFLEEARQDEKYQKKLYNLSADTQFDEETMKKLIASDNSKNDLSKRYKRHTHNIYHIIFFQIYSRHM